MIKKILRNSITAIALIGLAGSLQAADLTAKVNGRVRSYIENVTIKDGPSMTRMAADGQLGVDATVTEGSWTVTLFQNMDLETDDGSTTPTTREQKITLENESMAATLGRFYPYGVSKGMTYAAGEISDYTTFWAGEYPPTSALNNHLAIDLKGLGVTILLAMNHYDDGDTTADERNETVIGAQYSNSFGAIDLTAQVLSGSSAIDEKDDDVLKSGYYDGMAYSSLAFGLQYNISDMMDVALNYEGNSTTGGDKSEMTMTITEFWFDMGLNESSGISIGYGTQASTTNAVGDDNPTNATQTAILYKKSIGPLDLHASYLATTEKDDDTAVDAGTTTVAVGMALGF